MIKTFSELIKEREFFIPGYQRAYSWTDKQVLLFIADIAEHARNKDKKTQYYLGHYILEDDGNEKLAIVDGQQRLTTIAIFFAVCQFLKNSSTPLPSLRLNVVEYDNNRFQEMLLPINMAGFLGDQERRQNEATASLEQVVKAIQTILDSFPTAKKQHPPALLSVAQIDAYFDVIREAAVSVAIYESKAVAAQIFELHNTRGVLLTETEKVKALLMKYVYLNSTNGNRDVNEIQAFFAAVFQLEETAADVSFRGEMSLDDILAHHLRAIDDGNDKTSFAQPQSVEGENGCLAYVRKRLSELDNGQSGIQYAKALAGEFAKSMALISEHFVQQDNKEPLIGDVILLDQRRSMIFLLRYFRILPSDRIADHALLKRWESFLFLWDCHDAFYNMKSGKKDSFPEIYNLITKNCAQVAALLEEYYSGKKSFAYRNFQIPRKSESGEESVITGLAEIFRDYTTRLEEHLLHRAYNWGHWHSRYKYWLYKYEIEYESKNANSQQASQVRTSLRKLFKENAVTLDHIVPHELEWKALSVKGEQDNNIERWKDADDKKQAITNWESITKTIDGVGNLVLLSCSNNASLQNCAPFERAAQYESWGLKSVSYKEVTTWKAPIEWHDVINDPWQTRIEARGKRLFEWMKDYFTDRTTWTDLDTT
jgi:hypothetical protein